MVDLETAKTAKQIREVVEQTKADVEFLSESSRSTNTIQNITINTLVSSAKVRAKPVPESATRVRQRSWVLGGNAEGAAGEDLRLLVLH